MVAMMITMMKIANDNDDDLFCVTLLFWNLLAFLLLLIVAHLFWHLCTLFPMVGRAVICWGSETKVFIFFSNYWDAISSWYYVL